jgi:hypothetical protein
MVTHAELFEKIVELTGASVSFASGKRDRILPKVDIGLIQAEFGFVPTDLIANLSELLATFGIHKNTGADS